MNLLATALIAYAGCGWTSGDDSIVCRSPNGGVAIELRVPSKGPDAGPQFRVRTAATEVIQWSPLHFQLPGGEQLGGPCDVLAADSREIQDEFDQVPGKRRRVRVKATETTVRVCERAAPRRQWEVVLRAYDDAAAFRVRFPEQPSWPTLILAGERTQFRLPPGTTAYALPLNGFTTSYEKRYVVKPVADLPAGWLVGLPLLLSRPDGGWAAITEANVDEYAGLYLETDGTSRLTARLSPLPKEPAIAVRAPLPHVTPWRIIMVASQPGTLLESDVVLALSKPCVIGDSSWIKPGKTTFPWWNGYFEDKVPFTPGLNTATAKHYIDFCAEAGIPYHSLDGLGNTAWYGGPIVPYKGADPTRSLPEIDLPAVLAHAKSKGVRLRLWMHWAAANAHMNRAFPQSRDWGIEGVMLDFMDRDDQEMNRFVRRAVQLAADNRLTVTLHGCPKPTGLERTYPNLLTHEGVLNLEYNKWDKLGCSPDHQVTVAFTRMLAGPLDFHQGSFRTVPVGRFTPRTVAPLVMGTPCRTLAGYVVFQNHLPMVADYPSAYRGHPATPALAAIPSNWDDTKVIAAEVGRFIVIARRHGDEWHIGAMAGSAGRTLSAPLHFLGPGKYHVEQWLDDASAPHGIVRRESQASAGDGLRLTLEDGGGAYLRLKPVR